MIEKFATWWKKWWSGSDDFLRHERCTDRVAEAVKDLQADVVVNIQGDEPLVMPDHLEALIEPLIIDNSLCSNLIAKIPGEMASNSNLVKVVFDNNHRALYFLENPSLPKENQATCPLIFLGS